MFQAPFYFTFFVLYASSLFALPPGWPTTLFPHYCFYFSTFNFQIRISTMSKPKRSLVQIKQHWLSGLPCLVPHSHIPSFAPRAGPRVSLTRCSILIPTTGVVNIRENYQNKHKEELKCMLSEGQHHASADFSCRCTCRCTRWFHKSKA